MKHRALIVATGTVALMLAISGHADWKDQLDAVVGNVGNTGAGSQLSGLSSVEMDGGLKEALAVGTERAIKELGRKGGYLDDASVRIPLPGSLEKAEKLLRMMGQGDAVDEFLVTVNRAAEKAVPLASDIVGDAVRDMSIVDAKKILTGPDDAATQYFRAKTGADLTQAMMPIVKRATDAAGVTSAYKRLLKKAGPASGLVGDSLDIDSYVTEKALDGLFLKVAEEEKAIRTNPLERSSDLLQKVFGSVAR
ncbi:MAG: DUF4197 domain-containing protein [Pseudomonadales bacterium]|nr:DUF4197 domain-containing protein [Gammaproteobacteria bacterium]MBP6229376.1 DUF4197 domain-containing protein [Pseudomonadales bacterium]